MFSKFNKKNTITGLTQSSGDTTKVVRKGTGEDKKWSGGREGKAVPKEKQPVEKTYRKDPVTGKVVDYPAKIYVEKRKKAYEVAKPVVPKTKSDSTKGYGVKKPSYIFY